MAIYFEPDAGGDLASTSLVTSCIEGAAGAVLLNEQVVPGDFFDLSTGFAGELLHGLTKYGLRLAVVVPDPTRHSQPFQDFCRESNRGHQFRFFPTRALAVEWLQSTDPS